LDRAFAFVGSAVRIHRNRQLQTHLCQRGIYCLAIFRLIDTFKGTLVVDESDWKQTDERV
jgi:hypothetical protein